MAQDIVLIGAGRSPHTRARRRAKGFPSRNRWIGPVQVRTSMRYPVDAAFVKQWYEQIVKAVEDGVLLVEYKLDRFVDADELKTLASGSEEELAAYEKKATEKTPEKPHASPPGTDPVLDTMPVQKPGADEIPEGTEGTPDDQGPDLSSGTEEHPTNLNTIDRSEEEKGVEIESAPLNTVEGSREEPMTSPRDVAQQALEEVAGTEGTGSDYQPLPDDWRSGSKADLLAHCEQRGIDTSDTPSNRVLRQRLDEYASRAG